MTQHLNWRYATKKFDTSKKVSPQDLNDVLEALRFSPSSFGLQPWKFVIVTDEALRQKLKAHAFGQNQIVDASHLIVLCSLKTVSKEYVADFITHTAQARGVERQSLAGYEQTMLGSLGNMTSEWMKRQVYLALGMLLSECAHRQIDTCPMEGFDPKKFDDVLGLAAQGIESVVLCPIGYRATDDHYANLKKVRFDKSDIFIEK